MTEHEEKLGLEIRAHESEDDLDREEGDGQATALVHRVEKSRKQRQSMGNRNQLQGDGRKIQIFNLEEEELRDQEAVRLVFQRNQKMIKYLFGRCGSNAVS